MLSQPVGATGQYEVPADKGLHSVAGMGGELLRRASHGRSLGDRPADRMLRAVFHRGRVAQQLV